MAPSLRKSTQQNTKDSVKAAKDAGYVRKPQAPRTRKQLYTRTKGLVSFKALKVLENIGTSTRIDRRDLHLPMKLPSVCRQLYDETATFSERAMNIWLSKRLLAQRQAIRWMMLPCYRCSRRSDTDYSYSASIDTTQEIMDRARKICPSFIEMVRDDWLDECLTATPAMFSYDRRSREFCFSSGDKSPCDD
ncbi:hypothetical protein EK21DRAFT_100799 [Setomelanomma holmii]|uniref:Uncharacterized protein n=1 Tax=Setomelanomma holmii TaxID=210430 RepID=A0A9P4H8H7_9PLEO|nr:hypothetical protein EK21DRAFT_100799 [Setomelanomma holmii]